MDVVLRGNLEAGRMDAIRYVSQTQMRPSDADRKS